MAGNKAGDRSRMLGCKVWRCVCPVVDLLHLFCFITSTQGRSPLWPSGCCCLRGRAADDSGLAGGRWGSLPFSWSTTRWPEAWACGNNEGRLDGGLRSRVSAMLRTKEASCHHPQKRARERLCCGRTAVRANDGRLGQILLYTWAMPAETTHRLTHLLGSQGVQGRGRKLGGRSETRMGLLPGGCGDGGRSVATQRPLPSRAGR